MNLQISSLADHSSPDLISRLRDIFFESSTRTHFKSEKEKNEFEYRYLGMYLNEPHLCFLAFDRAQQVLGYCLGSFATREEHFVLHPHLKIFESEIQNYPSHLHINLTSSARGGGVGSLLIQRFETQLQVMKSPGVHLITAKGAKNENFYLKNSYREIALKKVGDANLLMLGKNF